MQLLQAKDGTQTACIGNHLLHSRYSPLKEAESFLKKWLFDNSYTQNDTLIIIEPALGYLISSLNNRGIHNYIVIFCSKLTYDYCLQKGLINNGNSWYPDSFIPLSTFIDEQILDTKIRHIKILEWIPGIKSFPESSTFIKNVLVKKLKIIQGNDITTIKFGRKWFTNTLRNYMTLSFQCSLGKIDQDVILVASGYSLNENIEFLQQNQNCYFVVALPSSVRALMEYGIKPDLIVTTDPGFYALAHYEHFPEDVPIAMPLTAYPYKFLNPIICVNQGNGLDNLLINNIPAIYAPEMGTVAATALFILNKHCLRNIYILGLDFCMKDMREHVHPHSFDRYFYEKSFRLKPELQQRYHRIKIMTETKKKGYYYSKSMDTYSHWFNMNSFGDNFFRVSPSPVKIPIREIKSIPLNKEPKREKTYYHMTLSEINVLYKRDILLKLLNNWILYLSDKDRKTQNIFSELTRIYLSSYHSHELKINAVRRQVSRMEQYE